MKLFTCCLLLPFATMVVTAPIRAQRENVLSFLNDALDTTTEKTIPARGTASTNPPRKPVKEQDSEDVSEERSTESFDANGFTDAFKDPDSHEIPITEVVGENKAPSRRNTGLDEANAGPMGMSSTLVRDQGSGERTDVNSEEGLSGKQVARLSGDQGADSASQGTNLQRRATPGRVAGLTGVLAPGRSRELLDWDSLENNNGRPAPVGNRGGADYDETRELISSETYPIASPEHMPSSSSVPAKRRAP